MRFLRSMIVLAIVVLWLGACTRERPDWPEDGAGSLVAPADPATATIAAGPDVVPAFTPHVSNEEAAPESTRPLPIEGPRPESGLPPIPGNEELTPRPPTPTPELEVFTYRVQAGDTLTSIANRFGVAVQTLISLNQLADPSALRVGQEIKIPGEAPPGVPTAEGIIHVVQAGETLFGISRQYGVPLDQLAAANNITNPSNIRTGQRLLIPIRGAASTPGSALRIHVVQPGETLTSIAARYGVSPQAIIQANGLTDPNRIVSGTQLTIP